MENMKHYWKFPLQRTHTGILLGNGRMGAMLWGEGSVLRITIGRSDFWDRRGAMDWNAEMSFATIRKYLYADDQEGLVRLFTPAPPQPGMPKRPTVIPLGRFDLDFGREVHILGGELDMAAGTVTLECRKDGKTCRVQVVQDMEKDILSLLLPAGLKTPAITRVPAWEYVKAELEKTGFSPPSLFVSGRESAGWVQDCPAGSSLAACYCLRKSTLCLATSLGGNSSEALERARGMAVKSAGQGFEPACRAAGRWWKKYWKGVPAVTIPNERLQFLYTYGMYKFAGLTNPSGVPATLQGPWVEEYQMPPWSNDYHFNINVQLCYMPAYHGNKAAHLLPLFEMLWSWRETLRKNAKMFSGVEDGLLLPHSTDDRAGCIGGYWAGSIDHASTCWMALMMYRYYRYTMDEDFLRRRAYPFMCGAMRVFEEMLERKAGKLSLPVSVSPEYSDLSGMHWGKNASFQLACIHALCEALVSASRVLGERPRPIWSEIPDTLPRASLVEAGRFDRGRGRMIAIWEGVPLQESHRHHSHLAGITPFDIFDLEDPEWSDILRCTLNHWLYRGMGLWTGWCVPWASMIHSRFGSGKAAEFYLEIFDRVFTNTGHGTLHDCGFHGFSLMGADAVGRRILRPEVMQMDGGMGAAAAVQEMLIHVQRGVTHVFRGVPEDWKDVSFSGMLTDGAFLVSGVKENGSICSVTAESLQGGVFRLANPWKKRASVRRKTGNRPVSGKTLEVKMSPGETVVISPV